MSKMERLSFHFHSTLFRCKVAGPSLSMIFFLKNSFVRGKKDSTFPCFMSITFTLKIRACCCCTYCHCPLPPVFLVIFTSCTVCSLFVVKMGALPILLEGHFTVVAYQWISSETEDDTFPVKLRRASFFIFFLLVRIIL